MSVAEPLSVGAGSARRPLHGAAATAKRALPILPALLFLLVFYFPLRFDVGSLSLSPYRVLLLVTFIPMLWKLLSGQAGRLRMIDIGMLSYAIWSMLSIGALHGSKVIEFGGSVSVELLGGYLLGRVCVRNVDQFLAFARFYGLLALSTLPFALVEVQNGEAVLIDFYNTLPGIDAGNDGRAPERLGLFRAQVAIQNPIHYGLLTGLTFSLLVVGMTNRWSRSRRLLAGGGVFLCSFLSLSSGAFLAVLFQIGLVIWASMTRNIEGRWIILSALAFLAYAVIEVLSDRDGITVFLAYATFSPATAYWRQLIFQFGMDNVWANPIFGLGLNDWVRPRWMFVRSVDNFWLLTAMRYGIPAFLFLFLSWVWLLFRVGLLKLVQGTDLFWARRAWMFAMLGLTFALATVHVWAGPFTMVLCLLGMGVWMLDADPDEGAPTAAPPPRPVRGRPVPPRQDTPDTPDSAAPERQPTAPRGPVYTRFPAGARPSQRSRPDP